MSGIRKGTGQPTKNVMKYVLLVICIYAVSITGYFFAADKLGAEPKLASIIDSCKVASLMSLLFLGGELAYHREQLDSVELFKGLTFMTRLIVPISGFIMCLIVVKLCIEPFRLFGEYSKYPQLGVDFYGALSLYLPYAATFPVFAYSIINAIVAFRPVKDFGELSVERKRAVYRSKKRCVQFFVFSNLTVLVPLVGVFVLLFVSGHYGPTIERDAFLSGAVAVIILVSSIAAKAVEEYAATSG